MSATDDLLKNAESYAGGFQSGELPRPPARKVAILTCMDSRILPSRILGFEEGEANVIRNAGGVVTDEEIHSLAISQRLLGTEEVILIQHTDCGMLSFDHEGFARELEQETGERPPVLGHSFTDLDESLRASIRRVRESPFIRHKNVRGFVYEVETGRLREVAG